MKYTLVDFCSGLGGTSDGFAEEGFQILGVEINPEIARLYKYPCIVADIREVPGKWFSDFDVIVGSPPCRDFSRLCDHAVRQNGTVWKWKEPKNPQRGLELVEAFMRIVKEACPKFWVMENVPYLEKHLDIPPKCTVRLSKTMVRALWGVFPPFLVPSSTKPNIMEIQGPLRKWERAKIPRPFSRALAQAIRQELEK